jgi:aminocarboxymuconate-semialdehyde decarboxylase
VTRRAPSRTRSRRRRPFTVDVHAHVFTPEAAAVASRLPDAAVAAMAQYTTAATEEVNRAQRERVRPKLTSVAARVADLDAMGIDVAVLSPAPLQYHYGIPAEEGREVARLINDRIAGIAGEHPDRFVGLGTVPMQAPDLAVAEFDRLMGPLGLRGVEIGTNVNGAELSDPSFRPIFARAEALGAVVFLHPNGFPDGRRLSQHYFMNVIGNPLDSTVAVSHLIFDGVLDAHPRLKILVAHGGGFLASYAGRMDHAYRVRPDCRGRIPRRPSSYLKSLYFDTLVFTTHQLEYLVQQYGATRIVLGTDYPFDMGMDDPVAFIEGSRRLSRVEKTAILGGNAARLFQITTRRAIC